MREFVFKASRVVLFAAALCTLAATKAQAGFVAAAPVSTGSNSLFNTTGYTVGYQFSVSETIRVTDLGAWDLSNNGFNGGNAGVRIWTDSGSLIVGTTVDNGDPFFGSSVSGSGFTGNFRYQSVSPVTLGPGTYRIGVDYAQGNPAGDNVVYNGNFSNNFNNAPGPVSLLSRAYSSNFGATNPFPNVLQSGSGYFGPNFRYQETTPPTIQITGLTGSQPDSANNSFNWNVFDNSGGSGLANVDAELRKNGGLVMTSGATSGTFDFNSLGLGNFQIDVDAEDVDGNQSHSARATTVFDDDVFGPVIDLTESAGLFSWHIVDPSGVDSALVRLFRDGTLVFTSGGLDGQIDASTLGVGNYSLQVIATDHDQDWNGDQLTSFGSINGSINGPAAVPEPTSLALLGIGMFGLLGWRTRRRKNPGSVIAD